MFAIESQVRFVSKSNEDFIKIHVSSFCRFESTMFEAVDFFFIHSMNNDKMY